MQEIFDKQVWLTKVKNKPDDFQIWWDMAKSAQIAGEVKLACYGYLAVLRLNPQYSDALQHYVEVRNVLHQQTLTENFLFDMFRLPKKTAVFLMVGTLNMEISEMEANILGLLQHGYRLIAFDCAGIGNLSGLGPSFVRRMHQACTKVQGELVLVQANPNFQNMLALKRIEVPQFSDMSALFFSKNK